MSTFTPPSNAVATPSTAIHRAEDELPFVETDSGTMQVLQIDLSVGLWVVRTRFTPGITLQTHKHTGQVLAFTISGRWHYLESEYVNTAGSYLFEPAGSVHTLTVPEDAGVTDVWFAVYGANLNMAADGSIESVTDAETILRAYRKRCRKLGLGEPPVILS
jgi:quercetin dioxygenase-like cupin family protein